MKEKTCCLTGHRFIPESEQIRVIERTETEIRSLIDKGVRYFGVGGAIGYDTLAAKLLFRLRDTEFPHIRVILVYPFDGYTSRWSPRQREEAGKLERMYDKMVRSAEKPGREAYLQRDRHLVDASAHCICFCTKSTGGTAYTVRYALKRGLDVRNTADYDLSRLT